MLLLVVEDFRGREVQFSDNAVNGKVSDEAFGLDGEEEFIMYAMPVGTVSKNDAQQEKDFYAFVNEQGL